MDNLEKRLMESLLSEFRDSLMDDQHRSDVLDELGGLFKSIDQTNKLQWTKHVPEAIAGKWSGLPMSTRLLVWDLCRQIASMEKNIDQLNQIRLNS